MRTCAILIGFVAIGSGFGLFQHAEILRAESMAFLRGLQEEVGRKGGKTIVGEEVLDERSIMLRNCRRLPLGFRLDPFMWADAGFALAYVEQIIEHTTTMILTVNSRASSWLFQSNL